MKVWHKGAGIAGAVFIGVLIWVSCNGGGGGQQEGTATDTAPCQQVQEFERFRYVYTHKIESPKPEGPVDETQLGEPPFAIPPTAESFGIEQEFNGSFVAPDRFHMEVSMPSEEDARALQLTFIGDQGWAKTEGTGWIPTAGPNAFTPSKVCDAVLRELDLTGLPSMPDNLNGLKTQRFEVEQAGLEVAATLFGAESDMGRLNKLYDVDVWLTEEGWPARIEAGSDSTYPSGRQLFFDVSLEIRDVNAGDIEVESPES